MAGLRHLVRIIVLLFPALAATVNTLALRTPLAPAGDDKIVVSGALPPAVTPEDQAKLLLDIVEKVTLDKTDPKHGNWQAGSDHCKWDGITCDPKTRLVTALDWSCPNCVSTWPEDHQIPCFKYGKLPPALSRLQTSLKVLKLTSSFCKPPAGKDNQAGSQKLSDWFGSFHGPLPPEYGLLHNLKVLQINGYRYIDQSETGSVVIEGGYNGLAAANSLLKGGVLPAAWGQLDKLEVLDLSNLNNIKSPLPSEWQGMRSLKNLTLFSLGDDGPGGGLPSGLPAAWGNLHNLQFLELIHLNFAVPPQLPEAWSGMTSLKSMYLSISNLTGSLPSSWGHTLTKLQNLNMESHPVHKHHLYGQLPASWAGMKSLHSLNLAYHTLSGLLPPEWGQLAVLQQLNLQDNRGLKGANGGIPRAWGTMGSKVSPAIRLAQHGRLDSYFGCTMYQYPYDREATALPNLRMVVNLIGLTGITGCVPREWDGRVLFRFSVEDYEGGFPCSMDPTDADDGPGSGPRFSGFCA